MTDTGKTRRVNEDSFAYRDDLGAFLVADGLGGHQAGDVASQMVATVLRELDGTHSLTERTDRLVHALRVVNGCLLALSAATRAPAVAGSTVAALLVDASTAVCVWAGDSRVYRWREGALTQLSRDHTEGGDGTTGNRAVTRAVGGVPNLELDVERTDARPGDRYLLCSDGLYGELGAEALAQALALGDPAHACAWLKEQALLGAANDNLTAVVVHVDGATP
jgi:serine/threonine-protein phosphatase Stp1